MSDLPVSISFYGNPAELVAATDKVKASIAGLGTATREATVSFGSLTTATTTHTRATDQMVVSSTRASEAHKRQSREMGDLEKATRGAAGAFTGLSKAMMFGSNAFISGAILGGAVKVTVDAFEQLQAAQARLQNAFADTGQSWDANRSQVEQYVASLEKASAFARGDLLDSLGQLERATRSNATAEHDLTLATDIANARHVDLAVAVRDLTLAQAGHFRGLALLGIQIPKVTTAEDALKVELAGLTAQHEKATEASKLQAEAHAKASDAASTYTAVLAELAQRYADGNAQLPESVRLMREFHDNMRDLEASLGQVLVPDIDHVVERLNRWLENGQNVVMLQNDLKTGIDVLSTAFHTVGDVIHTVDGITGSFKHTIELLLALKVASTVAGWIGKFSELKTMLLGVQAAEEGAAGAAGGLAAIGAFGAGILPGSLYETYKHGHDIKPTHSGGLGGEVNPGSGSLGQIVQIKGKYYVETPGFRGGPVLTPITAAQAAAMSGGSAAPVGGDGMRGAFANRGRGGSLYGVSLAGENAMIPLALKALAGAGYQVDVTSGYRTYAQQAALYARYVRSGFNIADIAAKPGQSNHETGNAVDVYVNGRPVDQSPGALAILRRYGLFADVPGDHEHLDLRMGGVVPATTSGGVSTGGFGLVTTSTLHRRSHVFHPASQASLRSALDRAAAELGQISKLGTQLHGFPDLQKALQPAIKQWQADIHGFQQELHSKGFISPTEVANVNVSMREIETAIKNGLTRIKSALQQRRNDFKTVWSQLASDALQAFDDETANWVAPGEQQLQTLEEQATKAADQRSVDQARKALAAAQKGSRNDSAAMTQIRNLLGRAHLAIGIGTAQAGVLGGTGYDNGLIGLISQLSDAARPSNVVDPQTVEDANLQLQDALLRQQEDGLQRQAEEQKKAYDQQRAEERKTLEQSMSSWERYYESLNAKASGALADLKQNLVHFFTGLGVPIPDWVSTLGGGAPVGPGTSQPTFGTTPRPTVGKAIGMAAGGLVTRPHFLVDTGGVVRGVIGEHGTEAVVPVGSGSVGGAGAGTHVHVSFANGMEWLAQFVDVRVEQNTDQINRRTGIAANRRKRAGRY